MCGICGIAYGDPLGQVEGRVLDRMTDVMRRRGPDSRGTFMGPGIGLGVRRLSIIDVAGGDQPISSEDGAVTVICNGEVYNYVELRAQLEAEGHRFRTCSDVETIVHLYEDLGVGCANRLRGMFAFALWDSRSRTLMLGRDRLGIKPLYYHLSGEAIVFGSEIKAILLSGRVKPALDPVALDDLMTFGFVRTPRTFVERVSALQAGSVLEYRDGRASIRRYWQVSFPETNQYSKMAAGGWAETLRDKLDECVRIHLRSDVPVGALLSAGIDSSAVASLAARRLDRPLKTFSLEFEDAACNEVGGLPTLDQFDGYNVTNTRATCASADFGRFAQAVWRWENVSTSGLEVAQMVLCELAAGSVKVVLTGEGSDELLGGYGWFRVDKLLRPLAALPLWLRRLMLAGGAVSRRWPGAARAHLAPARMGLDRYMSLVGTKKPEAGRELFSGDLKSRIAATSGDDGAQPLPDGFDRWHPFSQLQYYDLTVRMPSFVLHGLDAASMAASLEARVPFLDHELVELASLIPPALKMKRLYEKHVLREAVRGVLPPEIVKRRKRGLAAPYQSWMRRPLPDFACELLSQQSLRSKGYFNPKAVCELLEHHRQRRGDYGGHLLAVLATQLWDELFLHGEIQEPRL